MSIIRHNLTAMNAQRQFGINMKVKAKSTEKLSSGFKINRAADDAAGLSVSEKMRRQIRGLTKGVENSRDGVSLCQVADGALSEVNKILHRITELSVKAANGTMSAQDRQHIQQEINQLMTEVNRIGDTTEFNDMPLFQGVDKVLRDSDGMVISPGNLEFSEFELVDVNLGRTPISQGSGPNMLNLQAIVNKEGSVMNGQSYSLIYGGGGTSNSSFRVTDKAGNATIVEVQELEVTNYSFNGSDTWSREFNYSSGTGVDVGIKQTIQLRDGSDDEKSYAISYEFTKSADVDKVEFMFHVDSAYNNDDLCEGYFIDGARVDRSCVYSQTGSALTAGSSSSYVYAGVPDSLSIIDVENALAFSEKISFGPTKPDSLSIGGWSEVDDWSYYQNLNSRLGNGTHNMDLGFTLYYDMKDLSQKNSISFSYGIARTETDKNLENIPIQKDDTIFEEHYATMSLWIQSGADAGDGMYLTIDEMNAETLGIHEIDVTTIEGAERALDAVNGALQKVSANRSRIGAQQNRLEHTIANEENVIENTTAAESRIRDTNMADEMVRYSNLSILEQAGQAMMAQANQSNQGVLRLLQ